MQPDEVDLALLRLMLQQPRAGSREYARVLGIARGTVQSRIGRLERAGVVASYAAQLSADALGFAVQAFVHLHLAQGRLDDVSARLAGIPELLEAHSMTGEADMLCRVAARNNQHLELIVQQILALPGVVRTKTEIAMKTRVPFRMLPLLQQLNEPSARAH
jgi:DNA-binding Lrp family transcriptional regulator